MFDFSPIQIMIVLVIALLVFGARRLPEMSRSLGTGLREFKDGIAGHAPPPELPADPPAVAVEPDPASGSRAADTDQADGS